MRTMPVKIALVIWRFEEYILCFICLLFVLISVVKYNIEVEFVMGYCVFNHSSKGRTELGIPYGRHCVNV